jgi:hypothetical protein
MVKIIDRYKLDAEELKRELMAQPGEYRAAFDKMLAAQDITEEQRLISLNAISSSCAAICTFLYTKAGIELRTDQGALLDYTGYFQAKIWDIERKVAHGKTDMP